MADENGKMERGVGDSALDHSTHREFLDYYEKQSESDATRHRFESLRDAALAAYEKKGGAGAQGLRVADIGCGAGAQGVLWGKLGHSVFGLDINEALISLAKDRFANAGYTGEFRIGTAIELPWESNSMDVCLLPELLEHVPDWKRCLGEAGRILRPGGVLAITTNNKLCPVQEEFNLPLYSWYPAVVKLYFERLATTTRPQLVNFAKYPAVNWFTYYSLARELSQMGFESMDRFDVMDMNGRGLSRRLVLQAIRVLPPIRILANAVTPYTLVLASKHRRA